MNSIQSNTDKRIYFAPQVERIDLDNEISLALESPPVGIDETYIPALYNNNTMPFKV